MSKGSVLILMLVAVAMTTQVCAFNRTVVENALSQLNYEDKALYLADFLVNRKPLFDKLLKIMVSGSDLIPDSSSNGQTPEVIPFILDRIPALLESDVFRYILYVAGDEMARIDVSDKLPNGAPPAVSDDLAMLYMSRFNYLRFIKRVLVAKSARALLPLAPNATVDPQCYSDSMDFIDAVVGARPPKNETYFYTFDWALRMLDSFGKPSGGIEKGALYYVGSFDECMSVKAHLPSNVVMGGEFRNHEVDFGTRFCRVKFNLPPSIVDTLAAGVDTKGVPLALHWGICVPDSCHSSDVDGIFHLGYAGLANLSLQVTCFEDNDLSTDASAITAIVVLSVLVAIALLCTVVHGLHEFYHAHFAKETHRVADPGHINSAFVHVEAGSSHGNADSKEGVMETKLNGGPYDCLEQSPPQSNGDYATLSAETAGTAEKAEKMEKIESFAAPVEKAKPTEGKAKKKPKLHPIITSFSLYANLPKIFNASKNPQALHCVHGIRFFSLLWIVLGHTYNYGVLSVVDNPTTINLIDASELMQRFTFQGIMAAGFAVDTFFLLSSMLVTWLFLKDMQKKKLSVGYLVVYYVHRIWRLTPLYMLVLMTFTCLYRYLGTGPLWPETVDTADNCRINWWTNLLYINNLANVDQQCMGWTWYLADDMQLYIISPIFFIALWKKQVVGIILCVGLMLGGMASAMYKEYLYGGDLFSMHENPNYWKEVYIPPWCKVAAWMVGMLLGYAIYKYKGIRMKPKVVVLGWAVTWAVGLCLCYVSYTFRKEGGHPWSPAGSAVYEGLGRPLWAACLAWIIFACHNGRGGIINSILSWSGLIPLSRLTYAAYLIHPIMMVLYVFSKRSLLYLNDFDMAYLYIGHTVMTFLVSTLFSALFEAPMLGLEKLVLTRH